MVYYPVYVYEAATTLVTYSRVHDRADQPREMIEVRVQIIIVLSSGSELT
jgi:hypothetical protein